MAQEDYAAAVKRYDLAIRRNGGRPEVMFARIGLIKALIRLNRIPEAKARLQETRREYGPLRVRIEAEPEGRVPMPHRISRERWDRELQTLEGRLKD